MTVIRVPKPNSVVDPDRPISSLLQAQVEHLQKAEMQLPTRYRSTKYPKALTREGEAGEYIREVTEAIHRAHREAARDREKLDRKKRRMRAAAESRSRGSRARAKTKKKGTSKKGRKK